MFRRIVCVLVLLVGVVQHAFSFEEASEKTKIINLVNQYDYIQIKADLARKSPQEPKVTVVDRSKLTGEVRQLIAGGADVNATTAAGRTALMQAMFHDQDQLVELLLAHGANVNVKDRRGNTALRFASYRVNPLVVRWLLEKGADPNVRDESGRSLLDSFIDNPVDGDTPSAEIDDKLKRQVVCIRLLIQHGAQLNPSNAESNTPLMAAAVRGRIELVTEMLKLGADLHAKDRMGMTALIYASSHGETETVKFLLAQGARADDKALLFGQTGMSPLLAAIDSHHEETALLLLDHTPSALLDLRSPPVHPHGGGSYTALGGAIANGMNVLVRHLVKRGANLNLPGNENGVTPLTMAGQQHKLDIVQLLLKRGANIEARNADGSTAFMSIAAYGPNPGMLEFLIKRGAQVNAKNHSGEMALDLVRQSGNGQENEQVLLRHGAVASHGRTGCSRCR